MTEPKKDLEPNAWTWVLVLFFVFSVGYVACQEESESERQQRIYDCVTDPSCINGK